MFEIGQPRAAITAKLGRPAALGGPRKPGTGGKSCAYYHITGSAPRDQFRACFAHGKLASASTASTG